MFRRGRARGVGARDKHLRDPPGGVQLRGLQGEDALCGAWGKKKTRRGTDRLGGNLGDLGPTQRPRGGPWKERWAHVRISEKRWGHGGRGGGGGGDVRASHGEKGGENLPGARAGGLAQGWPAATGPLHPPRVAPQGGVRGGGRKRPGGGAFFYPGRPRNIKGGFSMTAPWGELGGPLGVRVG